MFSFACLLVSFFNYSGAKSCIIGCAFCWLSVVRKWICRIIDCAFCWLSVVKKWIHPDKGALLRICHFDDMLDPSGIICAFLILSCLMGEVLMREHQVMEMMWLFPFHMLVWIHWLCHFSCILLSSVLYNITCSSKK